MKDYTIILELLSAGVIAALVTGIFTLVIAIKNNKRLIQLEKIKQEFSMKQEHFRNLRDAYSELLRLLPEEELLGSFIENLPSKQGFPNDCLPEIEKLEGILAKSYKILYSHFQKFYYLFSKEEQKDINDTIDEIEDITKSIIRRHTGLNVYIIHKEFNGTIFEMHMKRWEKVSKLEIMYYDLFKKKLQDLLM